MKERGEMRRVARWDWWARCLSILALIVVAAFGAGESSAVAGVAGSRSAEVIGGPQVPMAVVGARPELKASTRLSGKDTSIADDVTAGAGWAISARGTDPASVRVWSGAHGGADHRSGGTEFAPSRGRAPPRRG